MDSPEEAKADTAAHSESQPTGTRGSCSFFHNGKFYLYSGYSAAKPIDVLFQTHANDIKVFDTSTGTWTTQATSGDNLPKCISGACCTVTNNRLYTFGGWYMGERRANIHELDLTTFKWTYLKAKNPGKGPFYKDKAGMVAYGEHMVCVFGGYGYPVWEHMGGGEMGQAGATYDWDPNSFGEICWMNELHVFHVQRCEWFSPETTGVRPPPCAAFTFTKVDCSRVVLFGGRQLETRVNQVHILDMSNWHWSGSVMSSSPNEPWPSSRSFHTACTLVDPNHASPKNPVVKQRSFEWLPCLAPDLSPPEDQRCGDPKLLVLWGMDVNADPINDVWEFNVNTLTWKQLTLPESAGNGRIWHTMASHHPTPGEAEIVAFGGTCQNLFSNDDRQLHNVDKTTIFYCGVQSLYQLCLRLVVENYDSFESVLTQLPVHVQKRIKTEQQRHCDLMHFTTLRL